MAVAEGASHRRRPAPRCLDRAAATNIITIGSCRCNQYYYYGIVPLQPPVKYRSRERAILRETRSCSRCCGRVRSKASARWVIELITVQPLRQTCNRNRQDYRRSVAAGLVAANDGCNTTPNVATRRRRLQHHGHDCNTTSLRCKRAAKATKQRGLRFGALWQSAYSSTGSAARPRGGQLSELTELHPSSILICGFPARIRRGEEQDAAALSTRRRRQRGGSATAVGRTAPGTVPPVQYCPLISWNQAFGLVIIITTQTR